MAIKAWVHCVGPDREGTEKEIVSFLAENGVEIRNFDPYLIRDYGVLLFREFSVELCDFLREASPGCRERILAGSCAQLSAEHAWKLMQAGAADVLHCRQCLQSAHNIIARLMRWETVDRMMATPRVKHGLIGASPVWSGILRQVVEVPHFTDAVVLIKLLGIWVCEKTRGTKPGERIFGTSARRSGRSEASFGNGNRSGRPARWLRVRSGIAAKRDYTGQF